MLRGVLRHKDFDSAVLDVQGVGYAVSISVRTLEALPELEAEVTLWIHTAVREDAIELYGFAGPGEREMFRRLVSVSGVGNKTALAALSFYAPDELQSSILTGNEKALGRISGIGKKTAQRIILDLGDKLTGLDFAGRTQAAMAPDAWAQLGFALTDLGYKPGDIDRTVRALKDREGADESVQSLLKDALRLLRS